MLRYGMSLGGSNASHKTAVAVVVPTAGALEYVGPRRSLQRYSIVRMFGASQNATPRPSARYLSVS